MGNHPFLRVERLLRPNGTADCQDTLLLWAANTNIALLTLFPLLLPTLDWLPSFHIISTWRPYDCFFYGNSTCFLKVYTIKNKRGLWSSNKKLFDIANVFFYKSAPIDVVFCYTAATVWCPLIDHHRVLPSNRQTTLVTSKTLFPKFSFLGSGPEGDDVL